LTNSEKSTNTTNMEINNTQILYLRITLVTETVNTDDWDIGALTLSNNGREFILDPYHTMFNFIDGILNLTVYLKRDDETFPDCAYNLTEEDLLDDNCTAEVFFRTEAKIDGMTLHLYNPETKIKKIPVKQD
jgi:hypothetical protein